MKIPQVSYCCCGCSLSTGVKILAILGLVFGTLGFLSGIGIIFTSEYPANGIGSICGNVVGLIISGCLLHGARKRKPDFLLPYLVSQCIAIVVSIVAIPFIITLGIYFGVTAESDVGVIVGVWAGTLVGVLLALALSIYLTIVVYSFYRELKDGGGSYA